MSESKWLCKKCSTDQIGEKLDIIIGNDEDRHFERDPELCWKCAHDKLIILNENEFILRLASYCYSASEYESRRKADESSRNDLIRNYDTYLCGNYPECKYAYMGREYEWEWEYKYDSDDDAEPIGQYLCCPCHYVPKYYAENGLCDICYIEELREKIK